MKYHIINTFAGPFAVIENRRGEIRTAWFDKELEIKLKNAHRDAATQPDLVSQLTDYFNGEKVEFAGIKSPEKPTFFTRCREACMAIPRGKTISYAELAAKAGSPGAARAAGQAMRKNPWPVIVPCHRVVGSDGDLHGYGGSQDNEGSQLTIKRALLEFEGALQPKSPSTDHSGAAN